MLAFELIFKSNMQLNTPGNIFQYIPQQIIKVWIDTDKITPKNQLSILEQPIHARKLRLELKMNCSESELDRTFK